MTSPVSTPKILVADDEPEVRQYLETALRCQGFLVECAEDGEEALNCLSNRTSSVSLLLLDLMMPRTDGMETLREVRRVNQDLPVIVLSGALAPINIVEAMKGGATDFLPKPVSHDELRRAIEKVLQVKASEWQAPARRSSRPGSRESFVVRNDRMKQIDAALHQIGATDVPVLFRGESGVGKEVLARELHLRSSRAGKPFLKLNCAALPSELLESELFGYERGAFTGALRTKPGKFEMADGGTMLLDEIGDMDFRLQAKLLQVLQDHEFQRLGGRETIHVDVRILAATHCDLESAIERERFREDLYYRLNVISIHVPALRERKDEILPLAFFFLRKHAPPGSRPPEITDVLREALFAHDWPGNIRELENVMRRFLVFRDPQLAAEELAYQTRRKAYDTVPPPPLTVPGPTRPDQPAVLAPQPLGDSQASVPALEKVDQVSREAESAALLAALEATRWNRKQAATLLQMGYKPLLYKLKKLALDKSMSPGARQPQQAAAEPLAAETPFLQKVDQNKKDAERAAILQALHSAHWNRKQASLQLDIDYRALLYKMKRLGIPEEGGDRLPRRLPTPAPPEGSAGPRPEPPPRG